MAQIICKEVSLGYEGRVAVQNLNFEVNSGDYLCIVGENGAGKSTLMKALLGLNPPIRGTILMGDGLAAKEIGYLPQQTAVQKDFPASVKEVVLSGCLNRHGLLPFYRSSEKREAYTNMKRLGIEHLENRCYRELSGGQQQRVLLARALGATKKMVLLDEPVAGLDPTASMELYDLILKLNKEDQVTVVMVSHDLAAATKYASHILHVNHKNTFFGTKEEYLKHESGFAWNVKQGEKEEDGNE